MRHLTKILGVIFLALLFTGCASAPDTSSSTGLGLNCETAQRIYATYQAVLQSGLYVPSPQEIAAAAAAGIFLNSVCGWNSPAPVQASARGVPFPTHDRNGVLILVP